MASVTVEQMDKIIKNSRERLIREQIISFTIPQLGNDPRLTVSLLHAPSDFEFSPRDTHSQHIAIDEAQKETGISDIPQRVVFHILNACKFTLADVSNAIDKDASRMVG